MSTAPPMTYPSSWVRTPTPVVCVSPSKDSTPSVDVVAAPLTTTEAAMTANSPIRMPMSNSLRVMKLPAVTFWCQIVRMASRSASIQPSPDSNVPSKPMTPALPLLVATTVPIVLLRLSGR